MTKQIEQFNPEAEAVLTFVPAFQSSTFTVTGIGESLLPIAEAIEHSQPMPSQTNVEAPSAAPTPKVEYIDLSTLAPKEVLRRKISSWVYDRQHGTNMLGLLNERIKDDRNVRFARDLGLISSTHCLKHEKAVAKLKSLV
jgi:hypothetical protein